MTLNTNTSVLVLTTTTTIRAAGKYGYTCISNLGISDIFLSIGDSAVINTGIRLGSPLSAHSAATSRIEFKNDNKCYEVINGVAANTTTTVAIFYR